MKVPKGKAFSEIMLNYVSPLMAILGWVLIIVWYLLNIIGNGGGGNLPPEIRDTLVAQTRVETGQTVSARVFATDADGDEIHYFWGAVLGRIQLDRFQDDGCTYIAPDLPGIDIITVTVYDDEDASDRDFVIITIVEGREK